MENFPHPFHPYTAWIVAALIVIGFAVLPSEYLDVI
jgi:hypothetical protein